MIVIIFVTQNNFLKDGPWISDRLTPPWIFSTTCDTSHDWVGTPCSKSWTNWRGFNSVLGAQQMGGACCVYKNGRRTNKAASVGTTRCSATAQSDHTRQSRDGKSPTTKLIIENIPLSLKLGYKPRSAKMLMKPDHDWREWGTHPLAYWQEIPSHRNTFPPPSIPTPYWTMQGNAVSLWTRKAVPLCLTPGTLPAAAIPTVTSFADNVASQATSEGTPPAHCLRYHLRTTPPRMPRYHLRTTPPRMRYHLRTPPRTRQYTHSIGSWLDAVDWPRSQPFSGGVRGSQ